VKDEDPHSTEPKSKSEGDGGDLSAEFRLNLVFPVQNAQSAPCLANCPAGGSIREWLGLVAQRSKLGLTKKEAYKHAWELIVDRNPFPATMGRICPHPCESGCNRIEKDDAVSVNQLERFLGDWAISESWTLPRPSPSSMDVSVGVIGAGPAGLSFAYQMARYGYQVTVYDRHEKAGGMLRFGIPDYRLPPHVLDAEIQRIVDLGVELKLGVTVGVDPTLEELSREHGIIFVGIGAQVGRTLGIPGESGPGVLAGTEYLQMINSGTEPPLGEHVVVVGGGNTAIDAARAARRRNATVTVLYRRTRHEMPAIAEEVDDAIEEGVSFQFLASPTTIVRSDGSVSAVLVQRMELGAPDDSGRRRPVPVSDSEFEVKAETVISAISQSVDWSHLEELRRNSGVLFYTPDGVDDHLVLFGGDVDGAGIASLAIGQGRAAAEAAHLQMLPEFTPKSDQRDVSRSPKLPLYGEKLRVIPDRIPGAIRIQATDIETSTTITEAQFLNEVERCLSCGSCFGCQQCWMYCNAGAFIETDKQKPGHYFVLDLSVCEGCGKCIEVCPCGYLTPGPPP